MNKMYLPKKRNDSMTKWFAFMAVIFVATLALNAVVYVFYPPVARAQVIETKNCRNNEECYRLYLEDPRYVKTDIHAP